MAETLNEIVVSGISGRFPAAENLEQLWNNILITDKKANNATSNQRGISQGQSNRKLTNDLRKFDGDFFGLYPLTNGKNHIIDPYFTQLLEVIYEAILDSGTSPFALRGKDVGLFINCPASPTSEYLSNNNAINGSTNGNNHHHEFNTNAASVNPLIGRIASTLEFLGPKISLCETSSLEILSKCIKAIQSGECDQAIVAGINLLDRNKNENDANESDESEAVVALFLQKRHAVKREYISILEANESVPEYFQNNDKDSILRHFLLETYKKSNQKPSNVTYLEIVNHIKNQPLSKMTNSVQFLKCIDDLFNQNRDKELNSVMLMFDDNGDSGIDGLGNLKCVAGLTRLMKLILAVQHGIMPSNSANDLWNINNDSSINSGKHSKESSKLKPGLIGIHSIQKDESMLHVILKPPVRNLQRIISANPVLIPFSGPTKDGVHYAIQKIVCNPRNFQFDSLLHKIAEEESFDGSMNGHPIRGYLIRGDSVQTDYRDAPAEKMPLWLIFSGTPGSLWKGMADDLINFDVFAKSIQKSTEILKPFGIDLYDILMNGDDKILDRYLGTAYIAMGIAFINLLKALGIEPDGYIGHSGGELLCGYIDGCLTHKEALVAYYWKDEYVLSCQGGSMASVALSWEKAIKRCPPWLYVACHNAQNNVTVAGLSKDIHQFLDELKAENILGYEVNSGGVAYHTRYLKPMLGTFEAKLKEVVKSEQPRSKKWLSTSIPEKDWNKPNILKNHSMVDYIVNNIRNPVLFHSALKHIPRNSTVIEISPNAHIVATLEKGLPKSCRVLSFERKGNGNNAVQMLTAIGKLYENGYNPKVSELYSHITNYPVSVGTQMISPFVTWNHSGTYQIPDRFHEESNGKSATA